MCDSGQSLPLAFKEQNTKKGGCTVVLLFIGRFYSPTRFLWNNWLFSHPPKLTIREKASLPPRTCRPGRPSFSYCYFLFPFLQCQVENMFFSHLNSLLLLWSCWHKGNTARVTLFSFVWSRRILDNEVSWERGGGRKEVGNGNSEAQKKKKKGKTTHMHI